MEVGTRVVQGPTGTENQDGGEGSLGTVTQVKLDPSHQMVWIQWDNGRKSVHQVGQNDKHNLLVYDKNGTTHTHVVCDGCGQAPLLGLRWHCLDCPDYDLCTTCYMTDVHNLSHRFERIDDALRRKHGEPVGRREGVVKHLARGIFPGATVKRGHDWKWGDQDGGVESEGFVVEVCDWSEEGEKKRNAVRVQWFHGKKEDIYRMGYDGKFDLQCTAPVSAGHYYRDHLPSLRIGKTKTIKGLSTWDKVYMFMTAAEKMNELAEHARPNQETVDVPSFKDFKTNERRKIQRQTTEEEIESQLKNKEEEELMQAIKMSLADSEQPDTEDFKTNERGKIQTTEEEIESQLMNEEEEEELVQALKMFLADSEQPDTEDFETNERGKIQRQTTEEEIESQLKNKEEEELMQAIKRSLADSEQPDTEEAVANVEVSKPSETGAECELQQKQEVEDSECEHELMEEFFLNLLGLALAYSEDAPKKNEMDDNSIPPFVQWILSRINETSQQNPDSTGAAAAGPRVHWCPHAAIMDKPSNLDEDEILQKVLEISARESIGSQTGVYQKILLQHISSVMAVAEDGTTFKNFLNVRREFAFKDGIKNINRPTFVPSHGLSVVFADDVGTTEGAIDAGGPTREFLRIALHQMYSSLGIFGGPDHNKVLLLNSEARSKDMYRNCGKFLAVSLCNGGSVGNCLSKAVYDFLVYGEEGSHPQIVDVVDGQVQDTLKKIKDCGNEEAFKALVCHDDQIAEQISQSGYQAIPSFENREALIDVLCHYHVLDRPRSALEQLKEGLKMLGILDLITKHPEPFASLFCYRDIPLSPAVFEEQFPVVYADPGTPLKTHQEHVVLHWLDYLRECHAGTTKATLTDILSFATGVNRVPPLGFNPPPSIGFWENVRPRANTCINRLYLPLHHGLTDISYDIFKTFMDDGIMNSPCFGTT